MRDCPAKAIRIEDGQASVVAERCIGCGNCTIVCSQNAKAYLSGIEGALWLLDRGRDGRRAPGALVPRRLLGAAGQVVGALRAAGFDYVVEVAYGADLVNQRLPASTSGRDPTGLHIATACPAVVEYVRKYHPELTGASCPSSRRWSPRRWPSRNCYGQHVRCVFIGPCVAKKAEARDPEVAAGDRRGAHSPGGAPRARRAGRGRGRGGRGRTGTSRPPAGRACSRFPAACSRAPASAAACSTRT